MSCLPQLITSLGSMIDSKIGSALSLVNNKASEIVSQINGVQNSIQGLVLGPIEESRSLLQSFESQASSLIPHFGTSECYDQIKNILDSCTSFNVDGIMSVPSNLIRTAVGDASEYLNNIASGILGTLPEFYVSRDIMYLANTIMHPTNGIGGIISKIFDFTDCASGLGINIDGYLGELSSVMSTVSLDLVDGSVTFSTDSLFTGIEDSIKNQVMECYTSLDNFVTTGKTQIEAGIQNLKSFETAAREKIDKINEVIGV